MAARPSVPGGDPPPVVHAAASSSAASAAAAVRAGAGADRRCTEPFYIARRRAVQTRSISPENFTGEKGKALRRSNFSQRVDWPRLVSTIGVTGLHFHDLRHAGNVWAAQTGVSTRDLMVRMGHDGMRAALIYQRATQEAADRIAEGITDQVEHRRRARRGHEQRLGQDATAANDQ